MPLLADVLDGAPRPILWVGHGLSDDEPGPDVAVMNPGGVLEPGTTSGTVVLVLHDLAGLRRQASLSAGLGRARWVVAVVPHAGALVPLRPDPSGPAVLAVEARLDDAMAVTVVELDGPAPVRDVVAALARGVAPGVRSGPAGLRLAVLPGAHGATPAADPTVAMSLDPGAKHPPDVVVAERAEPPVSEVTGTAPLALTPAEAGTPLDEALYHPTGFRRAWTRGVVDLPAGTRLSPSLVRSLRDAQGVRLPPDADPELAAGLAMSGVPLVTEGVDLDDPDAREDHSIRQRRAALLEHATPAWRLRLAARAGVRVPAWPAHDRLAAGDLVLHHDGPEPSPDLVTDLLLARHCTGADVVGRPPRPEDGESWGPLGEGPTLSARHVPAAPRTYRIHGRPV